MAEQCWGIYNTDTQRWLINKNSEIVNYAHRETALAHIQQMPQKSNLIPQQINDWQTKLDA